MKFLLKSSSAVLCCALLGACLTTLPPAPSGWMQVDQTNEYAINMFTPSIKTAGENATIRWAMNYKSPGIDSATKKVVSSAVNTTEFQCGKSTYRSVETTGYSGFYGQGEVIYGDKATSSQLKAIPTGTAMDVMYKAACANVRVAQPAQSLPAPTVNQRPTQARQQAPKPELSGNNFLLGNCTFVGTKGDPPLLSCDPRGAASRNVMVTHIHSFNPTTYDVYVVPGVSPNAKFTKAQTITLPVTYQIIDQNNVIAAYTARGCTMSSKFTRVGKTVYEEALNQSGTCNEDQRYAFMDNKKEGRKVSSFVFNR